MRYGKVIGGLGVLWILVMLVGGVSTLFRGTFGLGGLPTGFGRAAAIATVALVVVATVVTVVVGAKSGRWLANPYW